jgi:hypothetical protein
VVEVARFRSGIAVAVLAGGLVAASGLPALAATSPPPTVSIAAKSLLRPVTNDVFVVFLAGKFANAQIHGSISGAATGDVVKLFARRFPFTSVGVVGSGVMTGPTASYSFTVTPTLATRYVVELFHGSTLLAHSATIAVYVSNQMTATPATACSRPVCRQTIHVTEIVPASTLKTEISKQWFFYFGLNLSATGTPPPPRFLTLTNRGVTITKPVALSSRRFTRTLIWEFRIGNDGYSFIWTTCSKDTEATDGLGLPGHHGCGASVISATTEYLG